MAQTLEFATRSRTRQAAACEDMLSDAPAVSTWKAVESALSLNSASKTKIGNAVQRGVSGGEKRRVTVAEAVLSGASIQCWDNCTRGMDSATALSVIEVLKSTTIQQKATAAVSLYQASQPIVNLFDKVLLLYEGEQIFFGSPQSAVAYFSRMGYVRPPRTSSADFLTAITSPSEARHLVRPNALCSPMSKRDLVQRWERSAEFQELCLEIGLLEKRSKENIIRTGSRSGPSNYRTSLASQVLLCIHRCYHRSINAIEIPISAILGNMVLACIVGGLFYNLNDTVTSVTVRSNLLFLSVLLNGFMSGSEVRILVSTK